MLIWLLKRFARLPLPVIHGLGVIAGWIMYFSSDRFADWTRRNLAASGLAGQPAEFRRLLRKNIAETGKSSLETLAIWFRPQAQVLDWVRACHGWEHVEAALQNKKGIIFLTPHLGCFEITSLYYAAQHPISVLYRPPRKAWLEPLIRAGRSRGMVELAPTNLQGVRRLLRALKQGEAIGILPDQVPGRAEGEWADFFGRPAYTMTLIAKLTKATQATVLMAFGERLPWGRGYVIRIEPFDGFPDPATLNAAVEQLVREKPEQYFWSYQRHKIPADVAPPEGNPH
ncbi:lipid A biosynthesis lauroyl acyltransferase [mine drainage metagenome]|uniref:Lipid A biosynthesis lauroyl acyltransferase n=1 Tax=mine drainage metagenome TaxID=410659 RepID=A0A1J5R8Z5_9ZZZZ